MSGSLYYSITSLLQQHDHPAKRTYYAPWGQIENGIENKKLKGLTARLIQWENLIWSLCGKMYVENKQEVGTVSTSS